MRMRDLYTDLGGANPLVHTRALIMQDIQEFVQFGPGMFILKSLGSPDQASQVIPGNTLAFSQEIGKIVRFFLLSTGMLTTTIGSGASVGSGVYSSKLHWPLLRATLRSGEKVNTNSPVGGANDAIGHVPNFWVGLARHRISKVMATGAHKRAVQSAAAPDFYAPGVQTTLDAGGDCHRRPLAVVNQAQLDIILRSDVCFLVEANNTYRRLECSQSGLHNRTTLHLGTSHAGGRTQVDFDRYMQRKKRLRPCVAGEHGATRDGSSGQSTTHAWNQSTRRFDSVPVRDELSLSRRVRISPLWNMLARLGSHAKGLQLLPKRVWAHTVQKRVGNARWRAATGNTSEHAAWNTPWVFSNTDDLCKDEGYGSISQAQWYNNPHKGELCHAMSENFMQDRPNCMKGLANGFNLCQIDKLKDFCVYIIATRAEIRQVNTWANAYTKTRAKLYLPSRFMRQDGIFGWSAIVETYNTISPDVLTSSSCPGIQKFLANAGAPRLQKCPSDYIFQISTFVETVRDIVALFVRILVLLSEAAGSLVLYLLSVLCDTEMQSAQLRTLLTVLKQLFAELQVFLKMMYGMMWNLITSSDGVFKSIQDLLSKLCNFAKKIVLTIVGVVRDIFSFISKIPGVGGSLNSVLGKLDDFLDSVLLWNCNLLDDKAPDVDVNGEKMHASTCWLEQAGFTMPSDFLGGKASEFACGPTSYCLRDVLSTEPAILCMKCGQKDLTSINTLTRGYTCDLPTKQCVCGEKSMGATPCLNSGECSTKNAICELKVNMFTGAVSSELCASTRGVSYCAVASVSTATGVCTTFFNDVVETTPTCSVPTLFYEASEISYKESLCVGYAHDIQTSQFSIPMSQTFVFPCTDIASAVAFSRVHVGCLRLMSEVSVQESRMSVVTYNTMKLYSLSRRLLSVSTSPASSASQASQGTLLLSFALRSMDRVNQVPGACGLVLRTCFSTARPPDVAPPVHNSTPATQSEEHAARARELHRNILQVPGCFSCAQMWWFSNFTLPATASTTTSTTAKGHHYSDWEFLSSRDIIVQLASSPAIIPAIAARAPQACALLFRDWLADDAVVDKLVAWVRIPIRYADALVYRVLHELFPITHPRTTRSAPAAPHALQQDQPLLPLLPLATAPPVRVRAPVQHSTSAAGASALASSSNEGVLAPRRRLLQQDTRLFDADKVAKVKEIIEEQKKGLLDELTLMRTQTYGSIFDSSRDMSCVISAGLLQNEVIISFANVLKKDGWSLKPLCTKQQILAFSQLTPQCPLLSVPVVRVYDNTIVLAEYYAYMMKSGCLSNMTVSCQPPPLFAAKGVLEIVPRLPPPTESLPPAYNETTGLQRERDIISFTILSVFYATSDLISFDRQEILSSITVFISMDALYDDAVHASMVRENQYTAGRLIRDLFDCNLRDSISCEKKNLPLLSVLVVVFVIILAITVILPVPSVVVFFMWTLGIVYGTAYLAYNFSPVCTPRIPTCLGSGLYEMSGQLLPERIYVPRTLYHYNECFTNLTLRPSAAPQEKGFSCGKTCLMPPYEMDNVFTLLISIESLARTGDAKWCLYVLRNYGSLLTYESEKHYLDVITRTARELRLNEHDYITGLYVCITFNLYKLVGLVLLIFFAVPAVVNFILSTVAYMAVLIVKYTLITYNTDIYDNIY